MVKYFLAAAALISLINYPPQAYASEDKQETCKEKYLPKAETKAAMKIFAFACVDYYEPKPKPIRYIDWLRESFSDALKSCSYAGSNFTEGDKKVCSYDFDLLMSSDDYFYRFILEVKPFMEGVEFPAKKEDYFAIDRPSSENALKQWKERQLWAKCVMANKEILSAKNEYSADFIHNKKCSQFFTEK
jgi:hypothetical protein